MAVETTNFDDSLKRIYQMVSQATLAPDADMDFATKLMMVIRGYLMKNAGAMAGGPPGPGGPEMGGGGMPPGMGGGGMGLAPTPGGMPPGAAGGMGMNPGGGGGPVEVPNTDELRRILGGAVV